jgi:hypothetical protein
MSSEPKTPTPIVFVGGTGRSGTHIMAELLDHHSALYSVPIECRFHCNPKGLADVVTGRATPQEFLTKLRGYWWHRVRVGDRAFVRAKWRARFRRTDSEVRPRGLHKIVPRERFEAAAARFEEATAGLSAPAAGAEPAPELVAACRRIYLDLLAPLAEEAGKPGLVEMSCFTIASAPGLQRIFPEALFIHSVRDGRDSGSSKVSLREKDHHPTDQLSGIEWWEGRLRLAEEGTRGMSDRSKLHIVCLDELVWGDRDASYEGVLRFLGIQDEEPMRTFFDAEMNATNAHRERWRGGLDEAGQRAVVERYESALQRLERENYSVAPVLRRNYERGARLTASGQG